MSVVHVGVFLASRASEGRRRGSLFHKRGRGGHYLQLVGLLGHKRVFMTTAILSGINLGTETWGAVEG